MSNDSPRENLPDELTVRNQWVCWRIKARDGKPTKIPIDPSTGRFASTTDSTTWSSFERALEYVSTTEVVAGLGFVFTEDDPFVGIDLDSCRDPTTRRPTDLAKDIVERLDSYTEISPSETGYHVIIQGTLPEGRNRHANVECYATSRYFTMTGDHVSGTPATIEERSDALATVHADYVAAETPVEGSKTPRPAQALEDEELLQKATQASNGHRFESLWSGSTTGYSSHSEADMALCCHLSFWTGGEPSQMDRLFRDSGLMREKWDEVHFADGSTYGEKTISRAISQVSEHYNPVSKPNDSDVDLRTSRSQDTESRQPQEQVPGREQSDERLRMTIERLARQVESLEAENNRLRKRLEVTPLPEEQTAASVQPDSCPSLLKKLRRFLGFTSESENE